MLDQITAWTNDVTSETIFWLQGPAGTGKSTISRTLALSFRDKGQLAAGYFFKRGEEDRNGTARFFSTIASQLVDTIPRFGTHLKMSLKQLGKAAIEKRALGEQFDKLIWTPISSMVPDKSRPLIKVIVVDALDECERPNHISRILSLLSLLQKLSAVRLRVFLTSRPAHQIDRAFKDLTKKGCTFRSLALDEEFTEETNADISTFLQARFASIKADWEIKKKPWPHPEEMHRLVSLATNPSPLFLYAATLCRFVDDEEGRESPKDRLHRWLEQCDTNTPQLNQIYEPILHQVFFGSHKEGDRPNPLSMENQSQLRQILGAIILLATPLPARGLAALLGIDEDDVNHWLRNFHAVLHIPSDPSEPIRLLHKSFSDFLLGDEGTGTPYFRVDVAETHAMLTSKCIQRMKSANGLRRDICNLQDPGKSADEVDKATIAGCIPSELNYACFYWMHHLQRSQQRTTHASATLSDGGEVHKFLQEHLLHWLEALSLMRRLSVSKAVAQQLISLIHVSSACQELEALTDNAGADGKQRAFYISSRCVPICT